ncbi:ABC transporter substrate-binding protein, partial [Escherichia coli]|uniref:ABC transporter substrate-binding protein n=1 Tax=Escherichia coli TaxID=562 RepID=UPI0012CAC66D
FTGLTKIDLKTMQVVPDVADRWEEKEDGKVYIFHLKKNVKWSDGTPFTADDVIFTYRDIYLNPSIPYYQEGSKGSWKSKLYRVLVYLSYKVFYI